MALASPHRLWRFQPVLFVDGQIAWRGRKRHAHHRITVSLPQLMSWNMIRKTTLGLYRTLQPKSSVQVMRHLPLMAPAVTRSSNTITDLFSSITLELDNVSASDMGTNQAIVAMKPMLWQHLKRLLVRLTTCCHFAKEQSKPGTNGEDGGPLHGDISSVTPKARLKPDFYFYHWLWWWRNILSSFGVVTELDGTLSIDETGFVNILTQTQSILLPSQHLWSHRRCWCYRRCANRFIYPWCLRICPFWRYGNINDSDGITENMSADTNRFGYASTIGATGLLLTPRHQSTQMSIWTQHHADPI